MKEKKIMKEKIVTYFPETKKVSRAVREVYCMENGQLVDTYQSFYRNGQLCTKKTFNDKGERIGLMRFRTDGTRISKMSSGEISPTVIALTSGELEEAITKYEIARREALKILQSRKINISSRATDKSLLKQFKQFEENRFSF